MMINGRDRGFESHPLRHAPVGFHNSDEPLNGLCAVIATG